jgi:hypothetical protein
VLHRRPHDILFQAYTRFDPGLSTYAVQSKGSGIAKDLACKSVNILGPVHEGMLRETPFIALMAHSG